MCDYVCVINFCIIIIIIIIIILPSVGVPEQVQKSWIAKQLRVRHSVRTVCGRQRVVQQNGIIIASSLESFNWSSSQNMAFLSSNRPDVF